MKHKGLIQTARLFIAFVFLISIAGQAQATSVAFHLFFPSMGIKLPTYSFELNLQNMSPLDATVQVDLYNVSGIIAGPGYIGTIPANGMLRVPESSFSSTPSGSYLVIISASQPINSLMVVTRLPGTLAGFYPGVPDSSAQTRLYFGPVDKHSVLTLTNMGTAPATVTINLFNLNGAPSITLTNTIAVYGALTANLFSTQAPADFSGFAVVSASQPLLGLLNYMELAYSGMYQTTHLFTPLMPATAPITYARLHNQVLEYAGPRASRYFLLNAGTTTGNFSQQLMNADGTAGFASTATLLPASAQITQLSVLPLPGDRTFGITVSGDQPFAFSELTGFLPTVDTTSAASYSTETAASVWLPRLTNDTDRHSIVSLYNAGTSAATALLSFTLPGAGSFTKQYALPAMGWARVDLKDIASGLSSEPGWGKITAAQPDQLITAVVDEFYKYAAPCAQPQVTLTRTPEGTVSPADRITFTASATGDAPLSYAWKLDGNPTGTDSPTFAANLLEGLHNVEVTVTSGCGASATTSVTLRVAVPCDPPTLKLAQSPAGVIYATDAIHFTAAPSGTPPFHYTWAVDGVETGSDSPSYTTTLPAGDHAVSATITNACSASDYTSTRAFTVLNPPVKTPEYSLSTLSGMLLWDGSKQVITYVAVLRNTGQGSANPVTFEDTLPDGLTYTPGSASASGGGPVTYNAETRTLTWTGSLDFGAPVVILYSTALGAAPQTEEIVSSATLKDSGTGSASLSATVPYRAGYGITINNSDLSTNSQAVELTFTYVQLYDVLCYYQLSNEPTFDPALGATGWLPLTGSPQVHHDWLLDPHGDPRQPRTVYIKFKTGINTEIGPFSASILYDVQPPAAPQVSFSPVTGSAPRSASADPWQWSVTATDDNSGVASLQISTRADFALDLTTNVPVTGRVTSFNWRPRESGPIYVRVLDRSGNFSEATLQKGWSFVYLPTLWH